MRFIASGHINFIFALYLLTLGIAGGNIFHDADSAWHLATGDLIRSLGTVPFKDTWSFTAGDEIWYNLAWIFDLIVSFLFSAGGFNALYLLTVIVFATSLLLMAKYAMRNGASPFVIIAMIPLFTFTTMTGFTVRPNMFSVLFTVIVYIILQAYRSKPKIEYLAVLPIIMLVWVNTHGGFLLAFLLMGLYGFEALLEFNRKKFRELCIITVFCLLAVLINPYGVEIYYGAYRTLGGEFGKFVDEWQPAKIMSNFPMAFLVVAGLVCAGIRNNRIKFIDRALVIIMLVMSLGSVRHIVITGFLMLPYICICFSTYLYESKIGNYMRRKEDYFLGDMEKPDIKILSLCIVIFAVIFLGSPLKDDFLKEKPGFPEKSFPRQEAEYIEKNYPNLRFFNEYGLGGYLDYIWRGRVKVFVDGRANSLYSDDLLIDSLDIPADKGFSAASEQVITRYKLDGLIIPNETAAGFALNPKFKAVYRGKVATVYLINK
ncbi:MAG: hypothetical protein WCL30_00555 [Pseudomonadota bacterium]